MTRAGLLAVVACVAAVTISPCLAQFGPAAEPHPSGLNIRVPGQLPLVTDGNVNGLLSSPDSVSALPVPAGVDAILLSWNGAPGVEYEISTTSDDDSVATGLVFDVPSAGDVPTEDADITLSFECVADGTAMLSATFTLRRADEQPWPASDDSSSSDASGSDGSGSAGPMDYNVTFYVAKVCGEANAACSACGDCVAAGTCVCDYSVVGSTCFQGPAPVETGAGESIATVSATDSRVRILSWNLWGVGTVETVAELVQRTRLIGETVVDHSPAYDIFAAQEVWNRDARNALVLQLETVMPYIARQGFNNGPNRESGLLIASKFPIEQLAFEEFRSSAPGSTDAITDKGVMGALLRVDDGNYLFVFNTHMQAGGGLPRDVLRQTQMSQVRQTREFIDKQMKAAMVERPGAEIGVVLVGDLNIRSDNTGAVTFTEALAALGPEGTVTEMYDALHDDLPTPNELNAADIFRELRNRFAAFFDGENDGESSSQDDDGEFDPDEPLSSRVDYGFWLAEADGFKVRQLEVEEANVRAFTHPDSDVLPGGWLADHLAYEFYVVVDETDVAGLAVGITIAVIVAVVLAAAFVRVYIQHKPLPLPASWRAYGRQVKLMIKKNYLMNVRNKRGLILQLAVPALFVFLLFVLEFALQANEARAESQKVRRYSDSEDFPPIPHCVPGTIHGLDSCTTFAWAPDNDPIVNELMEMVRVANNLDESDVMSFSSPLEADDYFLAHPNTTQGAYHVTAQYADDGSGDFIGLNYTIQINSTVYRGASRERIQPAEYVMFPMQHALESAALEYLTTHGGASPESKITLNGGQILMPHPQLRPVDVIGVQGPSFFLGALMFSFVIQLGQLVTEKEMHLRDALVTHGMRTSVYWLTWFIVNCIVNVVCAAILVLFGVIFSFQFFVLNDFLTYATLFFLFSVAMVPLSFLCSIFLSHARTATSLGFGVFLMGVILQGAAAAIYAEDVDEEYRIAFSFLPFVLLAKGMRDLGSASSEENSVGLRWADRASHSFFPLQSCYEWLIVDTIVYLALAIFLDFAIVDGQGESRLTRLLIKLFKGIPDSSTASSDSSAAESLEDAVGPDALARQQRALIDDDSTGAAKTGQNRTALAIKGLRKVYASFKPNRKRRFACLCPKLTPNPKKAFTAVDNMWLRVHDKQMFTILGHNGAGKTTTLSMLVGLLRCTDGDAEVFGNSLKDLNAIRKLEGVCPQHDVVWEQMTAREHIEMFAGLKGVPPHLVEQEVRDRLGDVELMEVSEGFAGSFSGGMRRRLSVAMALTANPAICYLDEPTTGMDPVSRRKVWNLLEREKRKRCVILTTHSMEEADVLSDNVAIMRRGRIQCMGPPVSLKRQFGSGFRITLLCKRGVSHLEAAEDGSSDDASSEDYSNDGLERAINVMKAIAPHAKLERQGVGVLEYVLPKKEEASAAGDGTGDADGTTAAEDDSIDDGARVLLRVLKDLEGEKEAAGILDIQVGLTSLEDVFLAVTGAGRVDDSGNELTADAEKEAEQRKLAEAAAAAATADAGSGAPGYVADAPDSPSSGYIVSPRGHRRPIRTPKNVKFDLAAQFRALTAKSSLVQLRSIKSNIFQILLPLALVFMLWGLQQLVTTFIQDQQGAVIPANYHPPALPVPFFTPETEGYDATDCPRTFSDPAIDSTTGEILVGLEPSAAAIAAAGGDVDAARNALQADVGSYGAPAPVDATQFWAALADSPEEPSGLLSYVTRNILDMISVQARVFGGGGRTGRPAAYCLNRPFLMPLTFDVVGTERDLDDFMFARFGQRSHAAGLVFEDLRALDDPSIGGSVEYSIMWNDTLSVGMDKARINNLVTNAVFRAAGGNELDLAGFRLMPSEEIAIDFDLISLIGPTFYVMLFQLIFPVALTVLVYEKQYKLREIMKLMGLKTEVYFASNYLVFFMMYLIAILVWQITAILLDFRIFVANSFGLTFILTFLWGNTQLALAFVASTFFSSAKTATVAGYSYIFASGTIAAALIRTYFESQDTPEATLFLLQCIPPFAMYRGLLALRDGVAFEAPGLSFSDLSRDDVPLQEVFIFLAVEWVLLCFLAWYLEMVLPSSVGVKRHPLFCCKRDYWQQRKLRAERRAAAAGNKAELRAAGLEEARRLSKERGEAEDVAAERASVWSPSRDHDLVRIMNMSKHYRSGRAGVPDKVAVDHLSLGIRKGECLGLLGPNGSGKTTTINTLSGYFEPTAGTAEVCGLDIHDDMDVIHQLLGVCPQENVLWENLSCADHIRFYGRLKDLNGESLDREVQRRLEDVELWDVADKAASQLSGGMKRRLCVAIALTGGPRVVLLDEPTTGLDPAARRQLWQVINNASRHASVLLTTHSMQEAEALCQRVGVFVRGRLRAIGTPAALKATVGDFYKVVLACDERREEVGDNVHEYITKLSPSASLITAPLAGNRNYQVLKSEVSLLDLVDALGRDAKRLGVDDWGVSSISLEEVFLKISAVDPVIGARLREEAAAQGASRGGVGGAGDAEEKKGGGAAAAPEARATPERRPTPEQVVPVVE